MLAISEQTVRRSHRELPERGTTWHLREIVARLRQAVKIPMGYQDMTGFHFGVERYAPAGPYQLVPARFHRSERERNAILASMRHRVV
jgi:hypothetical protein